MGSRIIWGSKSRTANNRGGEWAGREGPDRGAPRKSDGCALEEHCPARMDAMPTDKAWRSGREGVWRLR